MESPLQVIQAPPKSETPSRTRKSKLRENIEAIIVAIKSL